MNPRAQEFERDQAEASKRDERIAAYLALRLAGWSNMAAQAMALLAVPT